MKYCDNCGAELQDNVNFCDECGTVQDIKIEQSSVKKNRNKTPIIIAMIILIIACVAAYLLFFKESNNLNTESENELLEAEISDEEVEEVEEEKSTLLESITWQFESEKIQQIKNYNIIGYQAVTVGQAFDKYNVKSWSYGMKENIEYLLVEYEENSNTYRFVINATLLQIEEVYKDELILENEDKENTINSIFDIEVEFIGKSGSYSTVGATLNVTIEGEVVTSSILVDYYEEKLLGKVISSTEAEVYLESGEKIRYTWLDENKVVANPVDGFKQETINMIKVVCNALNNTVFTYESNTLSDSENSDFVATYMPKVGKYWNSGDGGLADSYTIEIHSVTNNSFIFSVIEDIDSNRKVVSNVIIDNGVAKFNSAEDWYAYYKNDTYDIQFDCSYEGDLGIAGYEPMTRITSKYFYVEW